MATKNRTQMSPKTEQAQERSHTEAKEAEHKEVLPLGRREQMPSDGHKMSNHNDKGNSNLRGKNLAWATRKVKG
jgi:hypothetical protein